MNLEPNPATKYSKSMHLHPAYLCIACTAIFGCGGHYFGECNVAIRENFVVINYIKSKINYGFQTISNISN